MNVVDIIRNAAPLDAGKVAALAKRPEFVEQDITVMKIMWTAKLLNLTYVGKRKPLTLISE